MFDQYAMFEWDSMSDYRYCELSLRSKLKLWLCTETQEMSNDTWEYHRLDYKDEDKQAM